ncbi:MAG: AAA family ATPase [Bacilli bacterium]
MLSIKLYTYKNNATLRYFVNNISENEEVILFSELNQKLDDSILYYVDITSTIYALKNAEKTGVLFQIEQSIIKYNYPNIKYIVDEKLSEYMKDNFVLIFNDIEILCDAIEDESKPSRKGKGKISFVRDLTDEQFNELMVSFNDMLIGHSTFKKSFEKHLKEFRLFNKISEHKILSLFIFGSSGIGKTEVSRILHKILAPSEKMIKINFGNYSSQGALNSLIGSPRGYIGSDDGELNIKLQSSNSSVILIDEFEKADKQVINFFLELLEEGKYTDLQGVEHDLDGYIIIFTSNINENELAEKIPPEFINRINYIVKFNFLNEEDKLKYLKRRTTQLIDKFNKTSNQKISKEQSKIFDDINLSKYDSIRDIELEIKKKFIDITDNIENKETEK